MSDTEQRELDAWIAEHVMGWNVEFGYWSDRKAGCDVMVIEDWTPSQSDFQAMRVLKKCAERLELIGNNIELSLYEKGMWRVGGFDADMDFHVKEAETLELAICLFAKKLFSK